MICRDLYRVEQKNNICYHPIAALNTSLTHMYLDYWLAAMGLLIMKT